MSYSTRELLESLSKDSDALRRMAARLLPGGEARDVAQEAAVVLLRGEEDVRRPMAYVFRLLRNLVGVRTRATQRRRRREARAARTQETAAPAALETVLARERLEALRTAVADLEEPYRTTILLRYFAGRTPAEIAQEMKVAEATVRVRSRRAIQKLRERLRPGVAISVALPLLHAGRLVPWTALAVGGLLCLGVALGLGGAGKDIASAGAGDQAQVAKRQGKRVGIVSLDATVSVQRWGFTLEWPFQARSPATPTSRPAPRHLPCGN